MSRPTVCVTGAGAGVDSAWGQRNLEARKMLVNRADSPASSARGVGRFWIAQDSLPEKDTTANLNYFYTQLHL
jgi:hypothetical protein